MKKLIKGLHRFQSQIFPIKKDFFHDLMKGQNPEALFITCSDSRINPHLMMSADPGDLFILRNAGSIIPEYGSGGSEEATIEFAVYELKVKNIIVCGHSHCGAIFAATDLKKIEYAPSLFTWIKKNIEPSLDLVKKNYDALDPQALLSVLMQEHVLKQMENLKTHPAVKKAIAENNLVLHAWIYRFETGEILAFDPDEGQFMAIKKPR